MFKWFSYAQDNLCSNGFHMAMAHFEPSYSSYLSSDVIDECPRLHRTSAVPTIVGWQVNKVNVPFNSSSYASMMCIY